jgi:dCMP deaminase
MIDRLRTDNTFRPALAETFLTIAKVLAERSTCPDGARHGAVITVDGYIIATGYGSPSVCAAPCERCWLREEYERTGKKNWDVCPSVHAELNCLLTAAKLGVSVKGGTLHCTKTPCDNCRRTLANAGVTEIYVNGVRE